MFARRLLTIFSVLFGFFALFFTTTPKVLTSGSLSQNMSTNFFEASASLLVQSAHADIVSGDGGYNGDGLGDSSSDGGCACGADSVGDSVGGGQGDSSGGCGIGDSGNA